MPRISTKICGLSEPVTLLAAIEGGAEIFGFNFFPPSPRAVSPAQAGNLAQSVPGEIVKVGLFVDPSDDELNQTLDAVALDQLQLHGEETPDRVREIQHKFQLPVMKAIKIRLADDLRLAHEHQDIADILLFDAKAPEDMPDALPGGNGIPFDWNILNKSHFTCPWMLSGGLTPENVARAVAHTGAKSVDVSSGVESAPGKKDPNLIKAFLDAVRRL